MSATAKRQEADIHLRVWLGEMAFDYRASWHVARNFIRDWRRKNCTTIELVIDSAEDRRFLPRLPCERLFLDP